MKLFARDIKDKELLFQMIDQKGLLLYHYIEETGEYEILYHSIDKTAHYIGKFDQKELETKIFPIRIQSCRNHFRRNHRRNKNQTIGCERRTLPYENYQPFSPFSPINYGKVLPQKRMKG